MTVLPTVVASVPKPEGPKRPRLFMALALMHGNYRLASNPEDSRATIERCCADRLRLPGAILIEIPGDDEAREHGESRLEDALDVIEAQKQLASRDEAIRLLADFVESTPDGMPRDAADCWIRCLQNPLAKAAIDAAHVRARQSHTKAQGGGA